MNMQITLAEKPQIKILSLEKQKHAYCENIPPFLDILSAE